MSRITELWRAGEAPARSGLYRADGSAREVDADGAALSWLDLGAPLDLDALLAEDPQGVTQIDMHPRCFAELPDASGYVCGGDGALGSEGFVARLDADRNLVWVMVMLDSNPFERVEVQGDTAVFFNNLGNAIEIDLTRHAFRP